MGEVRGAREALRPWLNPLSKTLRESFRRVLLREKVEAFSRAFLTGFQPRRGGIVGELAHAELRPVQEGDKEWDDMRDAILNVVGLSRRDLLGGEMPRLRSWAAARGSVAVKPAFPALTCTAQSDYLTGVRPSVHGIVGNGWHDRALGEVHFWRQSNRLVGAPKLWEVLRSERPGLRVANLFWW